LFEGSVLGLVIEVSFLSDLTSTELITGEIPCFLESVALVHYVLVCCASFWICLILSPELTKDLEWPIYDATIEHLKW